MHKTYLLRWIKCTINLYFNKKKLLHPIIGEQFFKSESIILET
jgi:hypothetical protein